MGASDVFVVRTKEQRKACVAAILNDMKTLERMLDEGLFERDNPRIGAEQEFCLVDPHLRPAMIGPKILPELDDDHFTTELAMFNLEANLDPLPFAGDALRRMEAQLRSLLKKADDVAQRHGARLMLTGILPTLRQEDLNFENITPFKRYKALNEAMIKHRGGDFEFHIKGTDELKTRHNTMLFEACNTSFQIHLQVDTHEFVEKYNWAQVIAAPVLAVATNSPLLFGKRLWDETRIAVFEQTVDLKNQNNPDREVKSRVDFGTGWLRHSVTEIFKYDIAYYRLLLGSDYGEESAEILGRGEIPKLKALTLHNGTIYKWNRPCYGITGGKPHLRIENRYIPAGPTILDEMANTAFWLGLMQGMPDEIRHIEEVMDFDTARLNFHKAAQMGLGAQFQWMDGKMIPASRLIVDTLLPMARRGLQVMNIDADDIDRYLDVIRGRVENHRTGSIWITQSYNRIRKKANPEEALMAVTAGMLKRQYNSGPVHEWDYPTKSESGSWASKYKYIHQVMSKELYTVQEEDLVDLVANVMDWRDIHHIPVENEEGEVAGIISASDIIKYYCKHGGGENDLLTVNDIMTHAPVTVTANTLTSDALKIMQTHKLGCLPVTKEKKLIGIVTESDFVYLAEHLFDELSEIETQDRHTV